MARRGMAGLVPGLGEDPGPGWTADRLNPNNEWVSNTTGGTWSTYVAQYGTPPVVGTVQVSDPVSYAGNIPGDVGVPGPDLVMGVDYPATPGSIASGAFGGGTPSASGGSGGSWAATQVPGQGIDAKFAASHAQTDAVDALMGRPLSAPSTGPMSAQGPGQGLVPPTANTPTPGAQPPGWTADHKDATGTYVDSRGYHFDGTPGIVASGPSGAQVGAAIGQAASFLVGTGVSIANQVPGGGGQTALQRVLAPAPRPGVPTQRPGVPTQRPVNTGVTSKPMGTVAKVAIGLGVLGAGYLVIRALKGAGSVDPARVSSDAEVTA